MDRRDIEVAAGAAPVELVELLPAAPDQAGEHDPRAGVGLLDRGVRAREQRGVGLEPGLLGPVARARGLVPDLPVAQRPPRQLRVRRPERALRAVAADQRAEEARVGLHPGRRRRRVGQVGPQARPGGRAQHDGQHREPALRREGHEAVDGGEVRRHAVLRDGETRALRRRDGGRVGVRLGGAPVDRVAHRAHPGL